MDGSKARSPAQSPAASVRVRLYRPRQATGATPALLWLHGGGFILGSPEQDERTSLAFARFAPQIVLIAAC